MRGGMALAVITSLLAYCSIFDTTEQSDEDLYQLVW